MSEQQEIVIYLVLTESMKVLTGDYCFRVYKTYLKCIKCQIGSESTWRNLEGKMLWDINHKKIISSSASLSVYLWNMRKLPVKAYFSCCIFCHKHLVSISVVNGIL